MSDLRPFSEIAGGIHWIKDSYVNAYIVEVGDDLILVDSGLNRRGKVIMDYIRRELEDRRVSAIYLTHHHVDHRGGLHYLHEHYHPRSFAHPLDAEVISGRRPTPPPRSLLLRPLFKIVFPFLRPRTVEVEFVNEGDVVSGLNVFHLPGHTSGSLGFLKHRTMFTGDAAVTDSGVVAAGANAFAEDIEGCYRSLRRLATMDLVQLLPGHGEPILEDADMRLQDAVERLDG